MNGAFLRSYARDHPLWTAQVVVSLIVLAVLLPVAWFLYRTPPSEVTVNVRWNGNAVRAITVHIIRMKAGPDRVQVRLEVDAAAVDANTRLRVSVPRGLRYKSSDQPTRGWLASADESEKESVCELRPMAGATPSSVRVAFDGHVFPRRAAVDMQIGIFAFRDDTEVVATPTELLISGLEGMTVDQVIPEPERPAVQHVLYKRAPWREQTTRDGIVALRATDRRLAARDQFWLFIVATLFGTLVSVVVSLVQTMINDYEKHRDQASAASALAPQ